MEYNFNEYLDDIVQPTALLPRERRTREPPAFIVRPHLFSMGSMQGPIYRESFSTVVDHSTVNLNFGQQTLFFRISFNDVPSFCDDDDDDNGPLQFPILQAICPIDDIESVQLVKHGKPGPLVGKLTVTLRRPPRFEADFRRMSDGRRGLGIRRATDLDWSEAVDEYGSGAPGVTPRGFRVYTPMKLGLWLTYRFDFSCSNSEIERVVTSLSRLRALDRPGAEKINVNPEADAQNMPVTSTSMSTRDHPLVGTEADVQDIDTLFVKDKYAFEARYLLVGLVSQGLVLPAEVADIIHWLWPLSKPTRTAALRALFRLQRRALVGSLAKDQIHRLSRVQPPRIPPGRVAVRRVVVTPTRVLLFPEVIEWGNRVLRAWPKQMAAGRFLRVGFADEDGQLRTTKRTAEADDIDPNGGVFARIRNVLKYGVCVAGRHYVFLAAGESQLKDHSCWMVCEEGDFTADRVRQQMGDFSAEHVVAKYAARMGLCLSATCPVVELEADDVEFLPDVKHGAYTYTDGVGNCSQELATLCAKALNSDRTRPSAVQIRMGGIKGVLSVHPHLEKNQVCIRPSMEKFKSPLRGLGVMRVSGYAPAHLNRQAICVMEALGVNITALLRAYEHQIDRAKNIELDFEALDISRHPARHLYRNAFIPVVKMVKAGFKDQLLLQNVLRCIKCQLLRDLKYKARVLVNDGAYLIGVADEYDVLEEGEIYCAITPNGPKSRRVITGQCTIFRSPCVHPGDARLVTAVDNPAFQNYPMTDVVVFSTKKAARNLPSMLGGGDLDGDFYTVLYDKDLQITREHEPMDYTPVTPLPKPTVEIADICDFVVDYIKSDVLGVVSHFFAAVADHRGPDHEYCLDLAKLASDAVDFPKSGVPVNIPDHLRPERYPDFMGKDPCESYKSTRVLGMMFRKIEPAPQYEPSQDICIDTRLTARRVPPAYLQAAGEMKQNYDIDMESLMRQHNLCEAEIIAGVSVMSDQKRRRAADDAIRGPVREGMSAIRSQYRRKARYFVKENPSSNGLQTWATACYQVTHVELHRARWVDSLNLSRRGSAAVSDDGTEDGEYGEVTRRELISFPWLWAQDICDSVADAVIKEEDEEEEDMSWAWEDRWRNVEESDEEEEAQVKQEVLED